ncbi:MAG: hypothetical protein ABMA14_00645 [Hyphomonadaceae bacterium]
MSKVLGVFLASAALVGVVPQTASAHERGHQGGCSDWEDRDTVAYERFYQELGHLDEGVKYGLWHGSVGRRDARQFDRAIGSAQQQLASCYGRQGYLTRWQVQSIQRRIEELHTIIHCVHDDGHDVQYCWSSQYQRR